MTIDGQTVEALVANQSAVTGEKTELGAFKVLQGEYVTNYNHPGNRLATIVEMNKSFNGIEEVSHEVAMHIAAMNPMAVSEDSISQEVKDRELAVAIDKTKDELIGKEVEKALRKVGINPNHVDSDDHIDSNITKGYITAEQGAQAREIKATVPGTVKLNDGMIQNIAKGRLSKVFKENCLLNQVSLVADPKTVGQYIQDADKEATVKAFYRIKLGE